MPIKLNVLGSVALDRDSADCSALLAQPKRFALLVYLTIDRPSRAHTRDELLAMFWPESPEDQARNALSQSLSFIRRAIGADVIVARGSQSVDVNRDLVSSDAVPFEEAALNGDDERALSLYGGPLLPGFHVDGTVEFDGWLSETRDRLRARATTSARALIDRSRARGDMSDALHWARIAQSLAPHDERAVRDEMEAHQRFGDRASALLAFESFTARLAASLELEPSPGLCALAAEIRATPSPPPQVEHFPKTLRNSQPRPSAETGWRGARIVAAAVAVIGIAVAWRGFARTGDAYPAQSGRFALILPDSARIRWEGSGTSIAISADGSQLAYVGGRISSCTVVD